MSQVRNYQERYFLNIWNDTALRDMPGSFGDACILPNGQIAVCIWHTGRQGLTVFQRTYVIIVFKNGPGYQGETGWHNTIYHNYNGIAADLPDDGEWSVNPSTNLPKDILGSETSEYSLHEALCTYSGICTCRTLGGQGVGLFISPYWSYLEAFYSEYAYYNGYIERLTVSGLAGRSRIDKDPNNSSVEFRPLWNPGRFPIQPGEEENRTGQGTWGGCVPLQDGRVLMWLNEYYHGYAMGYEQIYRNQSGGIYDTYSNRAIIYDPLENHWHWTKSRVTYGRYIRTAQILPEGKIFFPSGSGVWSIYDPVTDSSGNYAKAHSGLATRCCCLHPNSKILYFNARATRYDGADTIDTSRIYAFNWELGYAKWLYHEEDGWDTFYNYNSIQPLPSTSPNVDRVILFPGDSPTATKPKIVDFNRDTESFSWVEDTTDVGWGYSCSVYDTNGEIWLFPSRHDSYVKIYTPDQPYVWDKDIVTSLIMNSK